MLRLVPGIYQDGYAIASLVSKYFRWSKITLFYQSTESSRTSAQTFRHYAGKFDIELLSTQVIDGSDDDLTEPINLAKEAGARIFVFFLEANIATKLLDQGTKLKLFTENSQIIGGEELSNPLSWRFVNKTHHQINTLLNGYIGVRYHSKAPSSLLKDQFISKWVNQKPTNGYVDSHGVSHCDKRMDDYNTSYLYQFNLNSDPNQPIRCSGINYTKYKSHPNLQSELDDMMNGYDAVFAIAKGLHFLLYSKNIPNPTPAALRSSILNLSYTGLTGNVSFSTVMKDEFLDIGGRYTELNYDILNFIPFNLTYNSAPNVTFQPILQWHSENGFTKCNNISYYIHENSCVKFHFRNAENTLPLDGPPPKIKFMPHSEKIVLRFFSIIGIIYTIFVLIINYQYRSRRLVKINQPMLSSVNRLGILLGFIRVLIDSFDINLNNCYSKLWLEHLAFQFIFTILWVKSWRVYLVTCQLKRIKITEIHCFSLVIPSLLIILTILSTITQLADITNAYITIKKNQFEYIQQPTCSYHSSSKLINVMYGVDLLILAFCGIYCWLIRQVKSTVSNTSILLEGKQFN